MISTEHLELASGFNLDGRLEVLDGGRRLIFAQQQLKPHESAHIINQQ
jgi:hypothetical protein